MSVQAVCLSFLRREAGSDVASKIVFGALLRL